jgi:hypothetical protein
MFYAANIPLIESEEERKPKLAAGYYHYYRIH